MKKTMANINSKKQLIMERTILDLTNNGLDIIHYFYPQTRESEKPFKVRVDEQMPSAMVRQIEGVWKVIDYGNTDRILSPVDICMQEMNLHYNEAIAFLTNEFGKSIEK
jgi:hypothetical protein